MEQAEGYERRWWILAILCLSLLVIMLDNTIVNVAIPTLLDKLKASNSQIQWVVDAYLLVFAGLLLTMGALSDRFGRRHVLAIGLLVFGAGSALSAWAPTVHWLIADRTIMGLGAAMIMPSTLSIIVNVFPPHERARAIGIWAGMAGLGVGIGPVLGGWLLHQGYWWGSIFLVNLPVVVFALVVGHLIVPNSRDPRAPRLDPVGVGLSIVGLVTLVYGIIEAGLPSKGWTSRGTLVAFAVAAVFLIAFTVWELRSDHPMMNIGFFSNPRFTAANVSVTLIFFAFVGALFILTQYLQLVLGYSALQAGLRVAPMGLVVMIVSPLAGQLVERVGNRVLVAGGLVAVAAGLYYMSRITPADGYSHVLIGLVAVGVGIALAMVPASDSIMGSLPPAQAGIGSAMNDTTREIGAALGVAVIGSIWASSYASSIVSHLSTLSPDALATAKSSLDGALRVSQSMGPAGGEVIRVAKAAFIHGMGRAFEVGSAVAVAAGAVSAIWLPSRAEGPARGAEEPGVLEDALVGARRASPRRSLRMRPPRAGKMRGGGEGAGEGLPGMSTQVPTREPEGTRLSPEPMYANVEAWVADWFVPTFGDRLGAEDWCPRWWEHPEAVVRLESLWRAWEVLRLDPALGVATWLRDFLEPQWEVLADLSGPLRGCEHNLRNPAPDFPQDRALPASVRR